MSTDLALASQRRELELLDAEIDARVDLLLARFESVTANPRSMGYLRFLLKHYAKSAHPFGECVKDNMKRFGPGRTEGVCAVLKDTIRQSTHWRHGPPKGLHPGHPDTGSPGVGIAEADAPAAPPWGGHHKLSEALELEFGPDCDPTEAFLILEELRKHLPTESAVVRVLIGLDEPPVFGLNLGEVD